ncbi:Mrp/NBP35 family ATP-binding protein [Phycisphaerales bacterium AB-hyl4]|uniref:Iron-sulfur cluster carrier protein n=1 Tax=Natronomicrosphaera hydrolytica TaxID=3242702 RepID=A0ABV4U659_9BACT
MAISKQDVQNQLRKVQDPELHRDLVSLNRVANVAWCDGVASVSVLWSASAGGTQQQIRDAIEQAVRELGDEVKQVSVDFVGQEKPAQGQGGQPAGDDSPQAQARASNPLPNVKHIIAVGAGKGGVGKSTVSVNLAVGLARTGAKVGLLDGDIYGPSVPTMLGLDDIKPQGSGNMIFPFQVHGIKTMTIGKLVEADKPLIWRGPMAHGAFRQLATQTEWGELDYLIIDLPPGTGDVPLTLAQLLPLTGAVVVCTPQKVAQDDARRAVKMFQQLGIHVLGVVENMSYFIGDDGKEYDIFGRGGAKRMAEQLAVPFLGMVPINMRLRENCDTGDPTANFVGDDKLAEELTHVSQKLAGQVQVLSMSGELDAPSISVH